MGHRVGMDGCGKISPPPTGIRSPDRPARCEPIYRLSYRGPLILTGKKKETEVLEVKAVTVPFRPNEITNGMTCDQAVASAVMKREITVTNV